MIRVERPKDHEGRVGVDPRKRNGPCTRDGVPDKAGGTVALERTGERVG